MHIHLCLSFLVVCCLAVISSAITVEHPSFETSVLELLKGAQQQENVSSNNDAVDSAAAFSSPVALIDTSVNLAESIASMISQEKEQTAATFKSLIQENQQHSAAQSELAKQRSELQQRGVFLERVSNCLQEGPSSSLLAQKEKALFDKETELMKQKDEIARLRKEFATKEAAFVAREELVHRKETSIKQSLEKQTQGTSLLQQKADELKSHAGLVKKAEADIMSRVKNMNKREEDLASREKDVTKMLDDVRSQQFRFSEVREKHREMFLKDAGDICATYDKCGSCTGNSKCGWCASSADGSQGRCLSHNVNAASDGLDRKSVV